MAARPLLLTKSPPNKSPLSKSHLSKSPLSKSPFTKLPPNKSHPSKSPPNKSLRRKTLGKGGSQRNIPRLTGNGVIMAGELDYIVKHLEPGPIYDITEDIYPITSSIGHYVVYGLMIYNWFVSTNIDANNFLGHYIDVSEFEEGLDYGKWKDYPKEFIIYFYRKITGPSSDVELFEEVFDETLGDLVENGYLTYSRDPFVGYFTIYKPPTYNYKNRLPMYSSQITRDDTVEDMENGHITSILGENASMSNYNWDDILLEFSGKVRSCLFEVDPRSGGLIVGSREHLDELDKTEDTFYILKNLENIIMRMIDTKYIKYKGWMCYRIEIEKKIFLFA